jgi:DNA-binding CsgD family transcriptional regulator
MIVATYHPSRPLSARQTDIMRLLSRGYTRAQAASMLGVTASTVRTHLDMAIAKLGARSTTHAVAIYTAVSGESPWDNAMVTESTGGPAPITGLT